MQLTEIVATVTLYKSRTLEKKSNVVDCTETHSGGGGAKKKGGDYGGGWSRGVLGRKKESSASRKNA